MKSEAIYHLNNLIQSFGYEAQQIELFKTKQSNKKPCYLAKFNLEKCSMNGFIFQDDANEWVFNFNQSYHSVSKEDFNAKVKESEFLKRKLNRALAKDAKVNLSAQDIKKKDIAIKEARKLKIK